MQVINYLFLVELKGHLASYAFIKLTKCKVNIFVVFSSDLTLTFHATIYNESKLQELSKITLVEPCMCGIAQAEPYTQ